MSYSGNQQNTGRKRPVITEQSCPTRSQDGTGSPLASAVSGLGGSTMETESPASSGARSYTHNDYTIGWICALPLELAASAAMLDEIHPDLVQAGNDSNTYTLGRIGGHNVAIACLPDGTTGTNPAATAAANTIRTFPKVRFGLMVGIGGGAPNFDDDDEVAKDIRLGDVVVCQPMGDRAGVVQYDFGRTVAGGKFVQTGVLNRPPTALMTTVSKMQADHRRKGSKVGDYIKKMLLQNSAMDPDYAYPGARDDILFHARHTHVGREKNCRGCDVNLKVPRPNRGDAPVIHYGLIGSANQLMRDAITRKRLQREHGIICFEMEAAGLMNDFPCLVIRGISDYADTHKNDRWQCYAAATAAAYAKEFLETLPRAQVLSTAEMSQVRDSLRDELRPIRQNLTYLKERNLHSEHIKILDLLAPPAHEEKLSEILDNWQEGTGQWFLETPRFEAWATGRTRTFLAHGIPGAGKTMMASLAIKHLRSDKLERVPLVAFFYCEYAKQKDHSLQRIYGSLLRQLAEQSTQFPRCVQMLYTRNGFQTGPPLLEDNRNCLYRVMSEHDRVFLVIDALDECSDETRSILLKDIDDMERFANISVMATSRSIGVMEERLRCGKRLEIAAQPGDIARYVEGEMNRLPDNYPDSAARRDAVKKSVVEAANGVFLLAKLHLKSLQDMLLAGITTEALQNLQPSSVGLKGVYDLEIQRIDSQPQTRRDLARCIIAFVSHAKRPLTAKELQHAMAMRMGSSVIEESFPSIKTVLSFCAGLIRLNPSSSEIEFIHLTTRQYFMDPEHNCDWVRDGALGMAQSCLAYLMSDSCPRGYTPDDTSFEARMQEHPFLAYSARYWGEHVYGLQESTRDICRNFLQNPELIACASQVIFAGDRPRYPGYSQDTPRITGVHFAALFGLHVALGDILDQAVEEDIDVVGERDSQGQTPLYFASRYGHKEVVKLLLQHRVDVNHKYGHGWTALHTAASEGYKGVVQVLLRNRADANVRDGSGATPLHKAAQRGLKKVVLMLLKYKANPIVKDKSGKTPLHSAAWAGYAAVLLTLLDILPDVDMKDNEGNTALHIAVQNNHEEAVSVLLRKGADPSMRDGSGRTVLHQAAEEGNTGIALTIRDYVPDVHRPDRHGRTALHRAAECGKEQIISILLHSYDDERVDVDVTDGEGWTALHYAAKSGHYGVAQRLLMYGSMVNKRDRAGWTPLHEAAKRGHEDVLRLLLQKQGDVHARDDDGWTPLHQAALNGHEMAVALLIADSDINAVDNFGRTARDIAEERGYEKVTWLLE